MDTLTILLLTYGRLAYAEQTLRHTLDKLRTTAPLNVHIASDGDPSEYIDSLRHLAGGYAHVKGVYHTNSEQHGYGANYNLATQLIHNNGTRWVMPIEDDWELTREFDIDPLLRALDTSEDIGCIRLGYMSYTQELRGTIKDVNGHKYLVFDPTSPEPHLLAGHPRIESVAWEREVGPWPIGLKPGATEFAVCHIPAARQRVAWPCDFVHPRGDLYAHFGTLRSYE